MNTLPMRSALRATLLATAFTFPQTAQATVFDDAYQCLKANAKMVVVTAEVGPKAIEFVVTQPQCVALVISPAPVPTGVMAGTLVLTGTNVLPRSNPACENALYTTGGKAVAEILGTVGLSSPSVKKLLADQASTIAIGEAVQAIPGASLAFASFSCGCGLSDVGVNPGKVAEIFNAIKTSGEKCAAIIGNLIEGGSEALVKGVSNLGDVLAGQTIHMDPQKYVQLLLVPRMASDYEQYAADYTRLDIALSKTPQAQCEHYLDKHTMSASNANKTCQALMKQYITMYGAAVPRLSENSLLNKARSGTASMATSFVYDTGEYGKQCKAGADSYFPGAGKDAYRIRYLRGCMESAAAYFGYERKLEYSIPAYDKYTVKKASMQHWGERLQTAASNPGGKKASQIYKDVTAQVYTEWQGKFGLQKLALVASINAEMAASDAKTKESGDKAIAQGKKDGAAATAAAEKAMAETIAKAAQDCKDDRCKAEIGEFIRSCKGAGSEGQVMNGDISCGQNRPIPIDISIKRVAFYAALDAQMKKQVTALCPPDMDCSSGVQRQRAEIDAEATKVWNYVREQGLKRGNVSKAREAIAQESANMLAPISARKVVAENQPKGSANIDPRRKDIKTYTPPVLVTPNAPPKVLAEPVKVPTPSKLPPAFIPPTVITQNTPPPKGGMIAIPPPSGKAPGNFGTPSPGGMSAGGNFPKSGNIAGNLGGAAAGSLKIEGCEPRGAQDPTSLVCTSDAGLNRCRSLIVSGKVKACIKK